MKSLWKTFKTHNGLVRLLYKIERAGAKGITTRRLYDQLFDSRREGSKIIKEAEHAGYIYSFTKKKKKDAISHPYAIPALTSEGTRLLAKLE